MCPAEHLRRHSLAIGAGRLPADKVVHLHKVEYYHEQPGAARHKEGRA